MSLLCSLSGPSSSDTSLDFVQSILGSVRSHLGMDVAYVSEMIGNDSVFRVVDAPGLEALIKPGDSKSLDDVYCRHILAGRIPELIPDTSLIPAAAAMPITQAVPIGAHVSVPVRLSDGSVYGMFCCLSPSVNPSLNARDLDVMRAFAALAAEHIDTKKKLELDEYEKRTRIAAVIADKQFQVVFQPIWGFDQAKPIGFECLTRFAAEPRRSPDLWFAEAASVELGVDLELAAIRSALTQAAELPAHVYVTVNASAEAIQSPAFADALCDFPRERLVIELTEHGSVADYQALSMALEHLRGSGARIAIDDAGAGYAGLQHIIRLRPDIIKMDMALTRNVDTDPARRALAAALVFYARETQCQILAEGIETGAELKTLQDLGIHKLQGYYLGRPEPFAVARSLSLAASGSP